MSLILYTSEQVEKGLSHGAILCTREQMDQYYLMHYRTKGSRNGFRRYQNEDGSYTPEGYQHYADMYGWGKRHARKAEKYTEKATKAEANYEKAAAKYEKLKAKAERSSNPDRAKKLQDKADAQQHRVNLARLDMDKWKGRASSANKKAEEHENRSREQFEREQTGDKNSRISSFRSVLEGGKNAINDILGGMERREYERSEKSFTKNVEAFDGLSPHDQKVVGDEVLKRITDFDNNADSKISEAQANSLRDWMIDRIDKKSGNWNSGESVSENHKKAMDRLNAAYEKCTDRQEKIKDDIDYYDEDRYNDEHPVLSMFIDNESFYKDETKRLKKALNNDRTYKALNEAAKSAEKDLCGAVLKDLGFSDTPENRSLIFPYVFVD